MDSTPEREKFKTTWESGGEIKEAPPMVLHCPLIKNEAHLNSTKERCAMRREIGGGCYTNPCGLEKASKVKVCRVPGCLDAVSRWGRCTKHCAEYIEEKGTKLGRTRKHRTCTKPGCDMAHKAKGLCRKHYNAKLQAEKDDLNVGRIELRKLRNRVGDLDAAGLIRVAKYVEKQILIRDK